MSTAKRKQVKPESKPTSQILRELGQAEGRASQLAANSATARELRADAAALERSSGIWADARILSGFGDLETPRLLRAMAAGMRAAAERIPSSDVPF